MLLEIFGFFSKSTKQKKKTNVDAWGEIKNGSDWSAIQGNPLKQGNMVKRFKQIHMITCEKYILKDLGKILINLQRKQMLMHGGR